MKLFLVKGFVCRSLSSLLIQVLSSIPPGITLVLMWFHFSWQVICVWSWEIVWLEWKSWCWNRSFPRTVKHCPELWVHSANSVLSILCRVSQWLVQPCFSAVCRHHRHCSGNYFCRRHFNCSQWNVPWRPHVFLGCFPDCSEVKEATFCYKDCSLLFNNSQ